ncbi:hypothetical protein BB559_003633 [Furculomyces boomerangus]|uniref:Nascent polypeptide-associated complex subunit alpha n=2 Tax=Harpellales TaxID=61421 RepID=A0A2T9YK41_9FUNG|nr:hypothetical protein BB559_003633 [Furculomyces boomerangus]PWA02807.1 hypothetical protein BB558_001024 [Smittium angustum]
MAESSETHQHTHTIPQKPVAGRTEKKVRKAMEKQGLEVVHGITRITMKREKGAIFSIQNPEVYKSVGSNTYIVFGEARMDDLSARAQMDALQRMAEQGAPAAEAESQQKPAITAEEIFAPAEDGEEAPAAAPQNADEPVDESGVADEDIVLVMNQANVSRSKAVAALKAKDNDVVEAIMSLM